MNINVVMQQRYQDQISHMQWKQRAQQSFTEKCIFESGLLQCELMKWDYISRLTYSKFISLNEGRPPQILCILSSQYVSKYFIPADNFYNQVKLGAVMALQIKAVNNEYKNNRIKTNGLAFGQSVVRASCQLHILNVIVVQSTYL